jgi:hypothetical protein
VALGPTLRTADCGYVNRCVKFNWSLHVWHL